MPNDATPGRRTLRQSRLLQIALIFAFWLAGEGLRRALGVPVPGGIIGLFMVLALLAAGVVELADLRLGARWFIGEMLLFFIPAVPALLDHPELFGWVGLKVFAAIVVGTVVVMLVTAFVVDACFRRQARHGAGGGAP